MAAALGSAGQPLRALVLASVVTHAPVHAREETATVAVDHWGAFASDLVWTSPAGLDSWVPDADWASFAGYYTEDLRSGYGGSLGRYDWSDAQWRFGQWTQDGPRAREIPWRSDRFGVYDGRLRWRTDAIGFERWIGRAAFDWAGSRVPGSEGVFPF